MTEVQPSTQSPSAISGSPFAGGAGIPSIQTPSSESNLNSDAGAISRIVAVPRILEVICRTTGMGFAAIARVTESHWVCCAVRDEIDFGIRPGDELKLETTICNEIRLDHEAVVIDEVATDQFYKRHHTPAMYGFQSYISVPIILANGRFFGTLCAIDPQPRGQFSLLGIGLEFDHRHRRNRTHKLGVNDGE